MTSLDDFSALRIIFLLRGFFLDLKWAYFEGCLKAN